jgi:cell division protein FtsB
MQNEWHSSKPGLSPLGWTLVVLGVGYILSGRGAVELPVCAVDTARQLVRLYDEYQRLLLENAELEELVKFANTPEGKEVLLRGRYHMVRRGEYVVRIKEPILSAEPRKNTLRDVIDRMRMRADQHTQNIRLIWQLIVRSRNRNWPPVGC